MKKTFLPILILILAAFAVFYFFGRGEKIDFSNSTSSPTVKPSPVPSPTPSALPYQKPAENEVIKFPIFNYHHIRPMPPVASSTVNERAFIVSPEMLEEHIKYFIDNDYKIVPVSDLIKYYDTGEPLPKKAVALSFDDGYIEHYESAFSILKKYNVRATFFIPTGWVSSVDHPGNLTWPQIQEMSRAGMEFGSHAVFHSNLTKLSDEDLKKELEESKKSLEEKTGRSCDLLSYPGGNYDGRVIEAVKTAGYKGAGTVYKIIEQSPKYRFSIRRFHADDNMESVVGKLTEAGY